MSSLSEVLVSCYIVPRWMIEKVGTRLRDPSSWLPLANSRNLESKYETNPAHFNNVFHKEALNMQHYAKIICPRL